MQYEKCHTRYSTCRHTTDMKASQKDEQQLTVRLHNADTASDRMNSGGDRVGEQSDLFSLDKP